MKVAVIGSRNINVEDIGKYLPENTDELVSDCVVAIWDGKSKGTKHVIEECKSREKRVFMHIIPKE